MHRQCEFCPSCGKKSWRFIDNKYWQCEACSVVLYHNVACSASVLLQIDDKLLLLTRSKEPAIGLLSLPGGFIDSDERAEEAAIRECREETGLPVRDLCYLGSWPNQYHYCGVLYNTCDFFFTAQTDASLSDIHLDPDECSGYVLAKSDEIDLSRIAFTSVRHAVEAWMEMRSR
ncbi:MAG TPA: NUDIX domain-containing protein [Treponemataceae bacterium]|nr:NUDIX domain-containing protein [Treponemataceae bacterium]